MPSKFTFFFMINIVTMVMAFQRANAQPGAIGQISINSITGQVSCSLNGTANAPPFPNASVQLQCAPGSIFGSTSANILGLFSLQVQGSIGLPQLLNGGCMAVVTTPLASCNASLPSTGFLVSALQLVQPTVDASGNIINNLLANAFQFISGL